jgi:hypothetical protein
MLFDRPIQIGQFIYVPVPVVPSAVDEADRSPSPSFVDVDHKSNKPLDLSKPKKVNNECEQVRRTSTSPLDLTVDKSTHLLHLLKTSVPKPAAHPVAVQVYECDYCSIRFSSLKTLHAHQENYCVEYRKQKKSLVNHLPNSNCHIDPKSTSNDTHR